MYRIHIWDLETGSIKRRRDYQSESLALKRAAEFSAKPGIREVTVTPASSYERIARFRKGGEFDGLRLFGS
jgi:hypothetical protein